MIIRLTFLVLLTLLSLGCAEGTVRVVDRNGDPIQGANVEPVSLSMNGKPVKTDNNGLAKIPLFIGQEVVWAKASKPGYQTKQVDIPDQWPLVVVLDPAE